MKLSDNESLLSDPGKKVPTFRVWEILLKCKLASLRKPRRFQPWMGRDFRKVRIMRLP